MNMKKYRYERFMFYDSAGVEAHLEKMAAKGWQLEKIAPLYWQYKRAEPQKLIYTATYFSEASDFNPDSTDNQKTFYEYCECAGWQLVAEWAQMQIFCSKEGNPVQIETDEAVKLRATQISMKKNFLPGNIAMLLICIFEIFIMSNLIMQDPVAELSKMTSLFSLVAWGLLLLSVLGGLIGYTRWYMKSKKALEEGGKCLKSCGTKFNNALIIMVALIFLLWLLSALKGGFIWMALVGILSVTLMMALVFGVKAVLRRAKVSRAVNITVTMIACLLLSVAMTAMLTWVAFRAVDKGIFNKSPVEIYRTDYNGMTHDWELHNDPLPLRAQELYEGLSYEHYSYKLKKNESFLLSHVEASQRSVPDGEEAPELEYEIVRVKLPFLYELCRDSLLDEVEERELSILWLSEPEQAVEWHANELYQLQRDGEPVARYLACYDDLIIYFSADELLSSAQVEIVAEKLAAPPEV